MTSQQTFENNLVQFEATERVERNDLVQPIPTGDCVQVENTEMETEVLRKRRVEHIRNTSSSEEGWNVVSRGRKARKEEEEDLLVQICVTCQKDLPKQFALAKILQQNNINNIIKVKYFSSTKMILSFDKETSADQFVQCKAFSELDWKCHKTSEVGVSYGVIKNMDLDLIEEELLKVLSSPIEIMSAKRLNRRNSEVSTTQTNLTTSEPGTAQWITSESIRLGFKGTSVPTHVFIHGMRIKVDSFVFPVTQCGCCWKFGHTTKFCPSKKIVCPKCTKNHENCESTTFVCVNCRGPHMAMKKLCPVFKKERRIRELMSEFNVTYRKAQSMYVPPTPIVERLVRHPRHSEEAVPESFETEYEQRSMVVDEPRSLTGLQPHLPPGITYADKVKSRGKPYKPVQEERNSQDTSTESEQRNEQEYVQKQQKKGQEQEVVLGVGKIRKKVKKRKSAQAQASTSMFDCNMEPSDCSEDHQENLPTREDRKTKRSEINDSDISFSRLLVKLKDIIFGNNSLGKKLELTGKICIEWLISKVVSSIAGGTFFSSDLNYG